MKAVINIFVRDVQVKADIISKDETIV